MQTAEPLIYAPSSYVDEISIEKLKDKSPGIDQIPAELIQAGGNILRSEIHKLVNSVWNKKELPQQWKEYILVPIYKRVNRTELVIIEDYHCYQLHTHFHLILLFQD
jgi:hypothetical protein